MRHPVPPDTPCHRARPNSSPDPDCPRIGQPPFPLRSFEPLFAQTGPWAGTGYCTDSNACFPRLTAGRTRRGSALQMNGFGSALFCATKRLRAALRSSTDRKMPRIRRRRVSLAKKSSTALSQDAEVGVKWKVQRGSRASHARTLGCLWVASSSAVLAGCGRALGFGSFRRPRERRHGRAGRRRGRQCP